MGLHIDEGCEGEAGLVSAPPTPSGQQHQHPLSRVGISFAVQSGGRDGGSSAGEGGDGKHDLRNAMRTLLAVFKQMRLHLNKAVLEELVVRLRAHNWRKQRLRYLDMMKALLAVLMERLTGTGATPNSRGAQDDVMECEFFARHLSLMGAYSSAEFKTTLSNMELARRLISECDHTEVCAAINRRWCLQLLMSRQFVNAMPRIARNSWIVMNTTSAWTVPHEGTLTMQYTCPPLPPTNSDALSNEGFLAMLDAITQGRQTQRAFDQILEILDGNQNELMLTCEQAEVLMFRINSRKTHSHYVLAESLLYQLASHFEVLRFLVRNFFFKEVKAQLTLN